MTARIKFNHLVFFLRCVGLIGILGLVGACSTAMESMSTVNQNLDEGRLVPAAAMADPDILNQYDFTYPAPRQTAAVRIELDRRHVYTGGGPVYAQVALVTKPAATRPFHLHVLIYDHDFRDSKHQAFIEKFLHGLEQRLAASDKKISLTIDSNYRLPDKLSKFHSLSNKHESNLKDFLATRSLQALTDGTHHFLLLSGKIKYLNNDQEQDVTDLGRVLAARNIKISVINYGEKPRFALLRSLASKGQGRVYFRNEFFDLDRVLKSDFELVNAYKLKKIEIQIKALAGASIEQVVSPANSIIKQGAVSFKIPEMLSGQQFVALLKLKVPAIANRPNNTFLRASLRYYDNSKRKYASSYAYSKVSYSMDVNDTLPLIDSNIRRSHLILATQDTIQKAAYAVRDGRNFKAIADITRQRNALKQYVSGKKDDQLRRDIRILDKFVANLHDFDQSWFQGLKVWKDMDWDNDRFNTQYE